MGKEFSTTEVKEIVEIVLPEIMKLDELTLSFIGGGELGVAL
jgi:hypothetical protein